MYGHVWADYEVIEPGATVVVLTRRVDMLFWDFLAEFYPNVAESIAFIAETKGDYKLCLKIDDLIIGLSGS